MNREDIIRMAREAGVYSGANEMVFAASLERFAALVAASEREACAKVCEAPEDCEDWEILGGADGRAIMNELAAAIRARGQS